MKDATIEKRNNVQSVIINHIDFLAHNAKCDKAENIIGESYCDGYEQALKDVADIVAFAFELNKQNICKKRN